MSLALIQQDFCAWLARSDADAAGRIGKGAGRGLAIYQNNYRAQLVACLTEAYERVHAWIGEDAFLAAAAAHIDATPPTHWTLDAYPAGFVATLAALYPDDPDIGELAWLDQALAQAFVAADADPVGLDGLGAVDWDEAVLRFSPSLLARDIRTNAAAIWSALSESGTPPAAALLDEPATLLVWRLDHVSCFRTADRREARLLDAARAGERFGALCALFADELGVEDSATEAGRLLGQWLADGLIVRVDGGRSIR
ncbi:HvfC/BufC N-terminal domain-containing protein [Sphingobium sp.]|uniref:HvfC/BufC N-terminal domain-containing protein n=1 Tax=Sphingobium sp. TaxID=1912891 RepID=UPI002E245DBC